ncbi:1-acylglycerol-3-phosphate O-acyltransferase Pnpla3, partial [Pseudolycoriella hygida]
MPLGEMTADFFRIVGDARSHALGPFSPTFSIQTCLLEGLQKFLPENAHEMVSGRLHVSLTRVYDGSNVIVSKFASREEVLQALLCACFIPGFSGMLPPRLQGTRYMDGAFSNNQPILDENTITVSPFCGESDICPRDQSAQLYHVNWANTSIEVSRQNFRRFGRILFPPNAEALSTMCQNGFNDALAYLHRNKLINCNKCLSLQWGAGFSITAEVRDEGLFTDSEDDYDPECKECIKHIREALNNNMPETVLQVFKTYIESANKGIAGWIFRQNGFDLLSSLAIPAKLPFHIMHTILITITTATPSIRTRCRNLIDYLIEQVDLLTLPKRLQEQPENDLSASETTSDDDFDYGIIDLDQFEHLLATIEKHEAIYSQYYMNHYISERSVKEHTIIDLTESKGSEVQSLHEEEVTQNLQMDTETGTDLKLQKPDILIDVDNVSEDSFLRSVNETLIEIENLDDSISIKFSSS